MMIPAESTACQIWNREPEKPPYANVRRMTPSVHIPTETQEGFGVNQAQVQARVLARPAGAGRHR